MDDELTQAEEQVVQTHCELCGKELQPTIVGTVAATDGERDQVQGHPTAVMQDVCTNPDCRSNDGDLAPAAEDQTRPDVQLPDKPTHPGSLGGDNGGA